MSQSEDRGDRDDDIENQLKTLTEWKENIGLVAVTTANQYKKQLDDIRTQNEKFKNELMETQRESRAYQDELAHLRAEKEDIVRDLKELKQEIHENDRQRIAIEKEQLSQTQEKDEIIQSLSFKVESLEIEKQSLESHLCSKEEECKAQQMTLDAFAQEIDKLKMDKSDLMMQITEYEANEKDIEMDIKQLQQSQNQDIVVADMKQENDKIKEELRGIKEENERLRKDNMNYKDQLDIVTEEQHALRRKTMEYESTLQEYEMVCNELTGQCQIQINNTIDAEHLAAQYSQKIAEMKETSEVSSLSSSPRRQKTLSRFLLPQKTINRINLSKASTLSIPSLSNTFSNSTRRIMTSVIDMTSSRWSLADGNENDDDNDSIATSESFSSLRNDENEYLPVMTQATSTKSRPSSNDLLNVERVDTKLFETRLKEEIKKEMDALEKVLHNEYNKEFEKNKKELIAAHQESLFVVTNAHNALDRKYKELKQKYNIDTQTDALPNWAVVLSHIFAI